VILEKSPGQGYRWKLVEAALPHVSDHQVLLRVHAVSLNRGDLELLKRDDGHDLTGLIVASDGAGEVVALGRHAQGIRLGERVTSLYFRDWVDGPASAEKLAGALGGPLDGVLGDYVVLDDTAIAPLPEGLSYEEGATLPTAALTAWMASIGQRTIGKGNTVVVQGTGGVSVFALQFATAAGARVIVTSSSEDKLARALALGANDGINYRMVPAWSNRVLELTNGRGADLIVDVGGKDTLDQSVKSLAYAGTLSVVGGLSGYDGNIPALGLLLKAATAQGIYVGSRADYLRMGAFVRKHRVRPVIDRVFPLERYDEALEHMASGAFVGKVVLRLAD
jgi:NADPH:quinone reductase-like Zn-dependent oxidoreductase